MSESVKCFPPISTRQCTTIAMKFSWVQSLKRMLLASFWIMTLTHHKANAQEWPYRVVGGAQELSECEGLGFPDAKLNECGYCTQGSTGLPSNFSMDCFGSCTVPGLVGPVVDCAGECGGDAYIDECSGQCIGGSTRLTEASVKEYRDCRGYCTSSGEKFYTDECGVCHNGTSIFQDCTNTCHLPGFAYQMAESLCGRCVGGNGGVPVNEVLDNCGNCISETVECPCNGTGQPDVCGECKGGGKKCLKIVDFNPKAIPANTNANIALFGAFRNKTKNLRCIFMEDGRTNVTEIKASGNGTRVNCPVRLKVGTYRVGIKLNPGDTPTYIDENELFVYENVEYTSMTPRSTTFDREGSDNTLILTFSGGKVPNLPLICIVNGEGWPASQKLSPIQPNTLDSCSIPYPKSSMKLNVTPSFNGIHPFKKSFQLKFYASPPEMRDNYIAEDGHAAVITFDRPVNLCELKTCSDILTEDTLERVGKDAVCEWATKQQLIITVQNPIATNPLWVTIKKGVIKQDGQKYALPKNESRTVDVYYPRPIRNAQLAISGPSTIPYCGTFTLVGHFSSPKGDAIYYWTAYRGDGRLLETIIANELLGIRTASLSLNASLLELEMNYTFVLTAEHPAKEKYEARHDVCRKNYTGPLVTAYSDVMSQPTVSVDQKITLYAELTLPSCAAETEVMHLMWGVNNPKVKFNFKNRHMMVYHIQPYSLPESSDVIFTAYAYFSNMINVTTSRVVLRVEQFQLKVAIKGTVKRIVGNKDGNLVLDSEVSTLDFPVVYQWKCFEGNSVCYNYKRDSTEPLLLPRKMQSRPKLVIPCASLKAGQTLTFQLQVFNANNRYQYSQAANTYVIVENRNLPQVVLDSVIADGIHKIERHPNTGAYSIPAGLAVTAYATVTPAKTSLKSVRWDVKGFSSSFTYTTVNGKTILSLEEGFLVGHGIYLIGLSACDGRGNCGIANLTIHAVPGIALCKLEAEPYVEYEMLKAEVKGCSIPLGRQPVTYQIFLHSPESVFPLTKPQTPTVFNIVGPAYQSKNGTQLSVEVCDRYFLCKKFPGPQIKVRKSENLQEGRSIVIDKAMQAMRINDPFTALSLFLTVASGPNPQLSESEINDMLNAGAKATKNRYINSGELSLIYSAMLPLVKHEKNSVKIKALEVIKRATKLAFGHKIKVPTSILSQGHSNAAEALEASNTNSAVVKKVKDVLDYFVQKISATAPLGSRVLLSSENPGYPSSLIFRQLLDRSPIFIKTQSKNGTVEGSVRFEEAVREKVRNRPCEGVRCDGIVVALTLYPHTNPYQSQLKTTSPVMDVTLRQPEDGKPFRVSDVPNAIRLALTHNASSSDPQGEGILYKCSYWDLETNDWAEEGVVTFGTDGSLMRCWSSHLTTFAVVETFDGLSAGSIVGIVVTVLMGVFIIMMLSFFYFRKKLAAKSRVSSEALQPKRMKDKMAMNGNNMRVKTVTP